MKDKCEHTHPEMLRYLQSKMTREEEARFQYHLLGCTECAGKLTATRLVLTRLEHKTRNTRRWIFALAVACLLGGGVIYWIAGSTSSGPGMPLNTDPLPIYHSVDSLGTDSVGQDSTRFKENQLKPDKPN